MSTHAITRAFLLDDLVVRTEGDGRTVDAYAAVFDVAVEIRDQYGHYNESIHRAAFNDAINRPSGTPKVLFNHGKDIYGNPSDRFAMPIGVSESVTADSRGLRTVTRISKTPLGDEVLELMRDGAIDAFSFQGAPLRSQEIRPKNPGDLRTIVRQQLGLTEYGPGVFAAYKGARVMALRAEFLADEIGELSSDEFTELVEVLRTRVPDLAAGRSDDTRNADDTDQPDRAVSEFDHQRRLRAASLRGLIP